MEYLKVILENILPVVMPVLGAFLLYLLRAGIKYLEKKFDFDVEQGLETKAEDLLRSGMAYAEEWAYKQAKEGERPSGADKMDKALEFINEQGKSLGMDAWLEKQGDGLARRIESKLGMARSEKE